MLLFDPDIKEASDPRPVNPLYLLGAVERYVLLHALIAPSYREKQSIFLDTVSFAFKDRKSDIRSKAVLKLSDLRAKKFNKVILWAEFATTMSTPHHIHEDGSHEDQPGRVGPIRTYFDGSYLKGLGHAVAICIDNAKGLITTQCPRGYYLPAQAEELLKMFFLAYGRITVPHVHQTDVHSCAPITIFNMCAFAGLARPVEHINIIAWRECLMRVLDHAEINISKNGSSIATKMIITGRRYRGMFDPEAPVHERRYAVGPSRPAIKPSF